MGSSLNKTALQAARRPFPMQLYHYFKIHTFSKVVELIIKVLDHLRFRMLFSLVVPQSCWRINGDLLTIGKGAKNTLTHLSLFFVFIHQMTNPPGIPCLKTKQGNHIVTYPPPSNSPIYQPHFYCRIVVERNILSIYHLAS